jgi:hypothetical protein
MEYSLCEQVDFQHARIAPACQGLTFVAQRRFSAPILGQSAANHIREH